MERQFTLEYWLDDDWYAGRLKEVPGVFSQGESLEELEENIRDAYQLMMEETETVSRSGIKSKEISVEVAGKGSSSFVICEEGRMEKNVGEPAF